MFDNRLWQMLLVLYQKLYALLLGIALYVDSLDHRMVDLRLR